MYLIKHTIEVGYEIENIVTLEREISTLFTSYRYKKDPSLLSPITIAQQKLHAEIGQLIFLTQDNPVQNERAKRIRKLSEIYFKLPVIDSVLVATVAAQQKASPQLRKLLTALEREEQQLLTTREIKYLRNLNTFNWLNGVLLFTLVVSTLLLLTASRKIQRQAADKNLRAGELQIANRNLLFATKQKLKRAAALILANKELIFQQAEKEKRADELAVANVELQFQNDEKEERAEELRTAIFQLNKSESSLKEAQAISNIGNFEIDLVNKNEVWSDGMYSILQLRKTKRKPSINHFLERIHPDDAVAIRKEISTSFKTYKLSKFEFRFYTAKDELRYGHTQLQFERSSDGKLLRLFGIFQDVTELKLAELERTKMLQDLIQRNKELEQFSYIISHNLRAPVANILGASEILTDNSISLTDKVVLKKGIYDSVLKLDGVIKDLNHILNIKAASNTQKEKVRFTDLVADIRYTINGLVEADQLSIICNFKSAEEI
ncbi:MAG: CHASE3 domain-containing protein, partial [Bacteroidia bacterium]